MGTIVQYAAVSKPLILNAESWFIYTAQREVSDLAYLLQVASSGGFNAASGGVFGVEQASMPGTSVRRHMALPIPASIFANSSLKLW